jgi:hypothetical protein
MQSLFLGLAVLACPVGMGLMMWMMMRGQGKNTDGTQDQSRQQVDQLRAEIEQLKAQRATDHTPGGH